MKITRTNLVKLFVPLILLLLTACVELKPKPETLIIADFDSCANINNLGGSMGAAYNPPDSLVESFINESDRGCVAQLNYDIQDWAAFWMKLQEADFSPYRTGHLTFDIRAEAETSAPGRIKIELKRAGDQIGILYLSNITSTWQTRQVALSDFGSPGYGNPLASFTEMGELVFTFEARNAGKQGTVYLDNITLQP